MPWLHITVQTWERNGLGTLLKQILLKKRKLTDWTAPKHPTYLLHTKHHVQKIQKKTKFYTNLTQENPTEYVQNKNAEIEK